MRRGEEGEGFFILFDYLFIYPSLNRPDTDQRALSIVHSRLCYYCNSYFVV